MKSGMFKSSAASLFSATWPAAIVAIFFLAGWTALSTLVYKSQAYLFPSPLEVGHAAVKNAALLWSAMSVTFVEAFAGFAAATVVGITLAGLMCQVRLVRQGFYPYVILLQTIPTIVIAPIIVLWFGYTTGSIVLISTLLAIAPIINTALVGLMSTSTNLIELFKLHHASRWKTFWELRLPAAIPNIFAGLRTSAGLCVIGAIVGEFVIGSVGPRSGLGVQIIFAQGRLNTPLLFAEVIAASILGLVFFQAVNILGIRLLANRQDEEAL